MELHVSTRVNGLLEEKSRQFGIGKENLTHSILVLALTDPAFLQRAIHFGREYLDGQDAEELTARDL